MTAPASSPWSHKLSEVPGTGSRGLAKVSFPEPQVPPGGPRVHCDGLVIPAHEPRAELGVHKGLGNDPMLSDIQIGWLRLIGPEPDRGGRGLVPWIAIDKHGDSPPRRIR